MHASPTMDLNLDGRTAIVCGGSAGIGLGVAEALAAEGANLVLLARSPEPLERAATRLGALAVPGDVTVDETSCGSSTPRSRLTVASTSS